jgi:hypothetical protein
LRLAGKSISGGNTIKGPFEWAGPGDQYFTALFIPDDPNTAAMVTLRNPMEIAQKPRDPQAPAPKTLPTLMSLARRWRICAARPVSGCT